MRGEHLSIKRSMGLIQEPRVVKLRVEMSNMSEWPCILYVLEGISKDFLWTASLVSVNLD